MFVLKYPATSVIVISMKRTLIIIVVLLVVVAAALTVIERFRTSDRGFGEDTRAVELLTIMGTAPTSDFDTEGRWSLRDSGIPLIETSEAEREKLEKLRALPYVQGSTAAPEDINVTIHDQNAAYDGVNLYNSGHGPEALAIDMDGRVLHRWRFPIENIWPDVPKTPHGTFWRRVYWYPNGDVLAIFEGIGMIKLDKDSKLLWSYDEACHHAVTVADDGRIYVLTREAKILPRLGTEEPILEDSFDILNAKGKRISRHSVLECFERSKDTILLHQIKPPGDIFHTNSIYVFDGSIAHFDPAYKRGNVLVSILNLNVIGIIDPAVDKMIWSRLGAGNRLWVAQHDPIPLKTGNMLIFDNLGNNRKSRVIEFNTYRKTIAWQYTGSEDRELFSQTCGTNQRLPNGNTLITESDAGRAIEVTATGDIVWEFYNPHRAGENNELIATLFEMKRVDQDYLEWLDTE
jgi:hypothetical protein